LAAFALTVVASNPAPASAWENDLGEVTLSESGGLSGRTLSALATLSEVLGVEPTVMQSGTIRMSGVHRGRDVVQSFDDGFAVPMSFVAVDPVGASRLLGQEITEALADGVVMSQRTAALRGAVAGDEIILEGWNGREVRLRVSAVVADEVIEWAELVFSEANATQLGIDRPARAVMWGVNTMVVELLTRSVLPDAAIRVSGPGSQRPVFVDWILPMVQVKEQFGEFAFRATSTDRIETDDDWYEANIITVDLPRIGSFRCHYRIVPYIRGALAELEVRGLADEIDAADFQAAGGCYNARLARGGDLNRGFAISRHSWGIAIDFNPSTNRFDSTTTLSEEFGQVWRDWGFAWGAGWRVSDPMHFEWHGTVTAPSHSSCVPQLSAGSNGLSESACLR
jgi:hypothetical protein